MNNPSTLRIRFSLKTALGVVTIICILGSVYSNYLHVYHNLNVLINLKNCEIQYYPENRTNHLHTKYSLTLTDWLTQGTSVSKICLYDKEQPINATALQAMENIGAIPVIACSERLILENPKYFKRLHCNELIIVGAYHESIVQELLNSQITFQPTVKTVTFYCPSYFNGYQSPLFAALAESRNISKVAVIGLGCDDTEVAVLAGSDSITELYLINNEISDTGLSKVLQMQNLNLLSVTSSQVTGKAFVENGTLSNIKHLELGLYSASYSGDNSIHHYNFNLNSISSLKKLKHLFIIHEYLLGKESELSMLKELESISIQSQFTPEIEKKLCDLAENGKLQQVTYVVSEFNLRLFGDPRYRELGQKTNLIVTNLQLDKNRAYTLDGLFDVVEQFRVE